VLALLVALLTLVGPAPPAAPAVAWGDPQTAWVGGQGGIYRSQDSGRTWSLQTRQAALQLSAVDASHAWAISDQGLTLRTTDGEHWHRVDVQKLLRIDFVDDTHGFAVSSTPELLATSDGGETWSPTPRPLFGLQSICFVDPRNGWAARGGTVFTTHDAGATWRARTLLRTRQGLPVPELSCKSRDAWVVLHGGAAAGSEGYAVYRSRDAGATWRAVYGQFLVRGLPRIDAYAGPVAALGGGDAVLEGSCGACGARGRVSFRRDDHLARLPGWLPGPLAFADRRLGVAVLLRPGTAEGFVLRTADRGRTWSRVLASTRLR
jgi:photosystem II stability/assembly factor-like uncharacterized protein